MYENRCRIFGDPCALIAVDLDGLKSVNDERGHLAGDSVIRSAADVLRSVMRQGDVIARLGGDEFGVVAALPASAAAALVHRLDEAFTAASISASINGAQVTVSTGMGAAWRSADENMYSAKAGRRMSHTAAGVRRLSTTTPRRSAPGGSGHVPRSPEPHPPGSANQLSIDNTFAG